MRRVSLDNHFAFQLAAPGSSCDLGEELKGPLAGPDIRNMETNVSVQDSYQRHIRKVQSFGNHLGADENIDLLGPEFPERIAQLILAAHRIRVDPGDARPIEYLSQHLFIPLRAIAGIHDRFAAALGAATGRQLRETADMANQSILFAVKGHCRTAVTAVGDITAFRTKDVFREAPSIEKEDGLLAVREALLHRLAQFVRKDSGTGLGFPRLLSHIDNSDQGHLPVIDPLAHAGELILVVLSIVRRFQRWRGTSQQDGTLFKMPSDHGNIASLVTRRDVLLV